MMKFILIILTILRIKTFIAADFDPFKIDFCSLKCMPNQSYNSACDCTPAKDREYITEDMPRFRQAMLDYQNDVRNKIANGSELKELNYPSAADMSVLNYDLELEHIARCYIMSDKFLGHHDYCRMTTYCNPNLWGAGQNLFGIDLRDLSYSYLKMAADMWYGELKLPATPEKRRSLIEKCNQEVYTGHFTMLVWAKHNKVGCVRAWIPNHPMRSYRYTVACNYAGDPNACTGNYPNKPVYSIGPPCSQCGANVKCNNEYANGKYNALCGQSIPAPKDTPPNIPKRENNQGKSNNTVDQKVTDNGDSTASSTDSDNNYYSTDDVTNNSTDVGNNTSTESSKGSRKNVNGFFVVSFIFYVIYLNV